MLQPNSKPRRRASFGLAALIVAVAVSSAGCQRDATASPTPPRAEMQTITVPVSGMICMVCAGSVKNTLKAVPGVQRADVDLEKHNVTVQYDHGKVTVDDLTRAINQLGYKAGLPTPGQSQ